MNHETKKQLRTVHEKILTAIKSDEVTMRSRYYFIARSILFTLCTVLAFTVALYLVSFVTFMARSNGLGALPQFGFEGWRILFGALPWIVLLLIGAVFVVLQLLSTHFAFVYKRPLVYSLLGSIVVLVVGGGAIAQTTLHDRIYQLTQERGLRFTAPLYKDVLHDEQGVYTGTLSILPSGEWLLIARDDTRYTLEVHSGTRMPPMPFANGDLVMVVGEETDDLDIRTRGIRPLRHIRPIIRHTPPEVREQNYNHRDSTPRQIR